MSEPTKAGAVHKPEEEHHVIVTPSAIVITLHEKLQQQAKECLRKSGRITFSFKEISVTKLPTTLADGVLVD